MDFSMAKSERLTAVISTLVAVAILAGGVTAYQSLQAPVDDIVQLESDLRFQLEHAFRHDPNERAQRLVKLAEVTQAWLQSPRTDQDREELAKWLLEATIRSMPGSIEALPPAPRFGFINTPAATQPTPDVHVEPPAIDTKAKAEASIPTLATAVPTASAPSEAPRPSQTASEAIATPVPTVKQPVPINLTELAARIAGYHQGLDELERALRGTNAEDFAALATVLRQLEQMTSDYQFVMLYYAALTDAERRAFSPPRPLVATLAKIERRLEGSPAIASDDFLGEFDANKQAQLDTLRQQLASIAARVER